MGQLQSNNSQQGTYSPKINRGSTRRSYSRKQQIGPSQTLGGSKSLPASPGGRVQRISPHAMETTVPNNNNSILKGFESVFGNLDLQWPTWAKRRGWVADLSDGAAAAADSSSGRVIQLGKDTWVFHRGPLRKKEVETQTDREDEQNGQRSRRSSGYASASSSPVTLRQKSNARSDTPEPCPQPCPQPCPEASPESVDPWRASLYEVTLRWMFHTEDAAQEVYETSVQTTSLPVDNEVNTRQHLNEDVTASCQSVRVHVRIFRQTHEDTPLFIDFRRITSPSDGRIQYHPIVPYDCDNNIVLDRESTCSELLSAILLLFPSISKSSEKIALYEKTWRPGKTSRARIQRLADSDYPFLLAQQWAEEASESTKTLLLQEIQSGDIPWEEFTTAELSSFLRVLDREEEIHKQQIVEKYKLLAKNIQAAMQQKTESL